MRGVGSISTPGLTRANEQLQLFAFTATRTSEQQVLASGRVRGAREQEVRDTVAGQIRERRALEETLAASRALAAASVRGSGQQIEANKLAATSAQQLGYEMTRVEARAHAASGGLGRAERGALAGSGAFRGLGRSVAFASLSFLGTYGLVGALRKTIQEAGTLNTQIARSDTIFGSSAGQVERWSQTTFQALKLARSTALGAANSFGTMLTAMKVAPGRAAALAEDITKVAAAASLARGEADPSNANQAFLVGLAGRGRALRQYGIILDQTAIKAKAIALGITRTALDPGKIALDQRKLTEAQIALEQTRSKTTDPLRLAKAEDAVTAAHQRLQKALGGTAVKLDQEQTAEAAAAIIHEQGARFVDRYGASLDTAAGKSRKFHEGTKELREELGTQLLPAFNKGLDAVNKYVASLAEGGSRHQKFARDLREVEHIAGDAYGAVKLLASGLNLATKAVGGWGPAFEIVSSLYLANKFLKLASAIRESRIALILLGQSAGPAGTSVQRSAELMAGGFATPLGKLGKLRAGLAALGRLAPIVIGIELLVNENFQKSVGGFIQKYVPGEKALSDFVDRHVGFLRRLDQAHGFFPKDQQATSTSTQVKPTKVAPEELANLKEQAKQQKLAQLEVQQQAAIAAQKTRAQAADLAAKAREQQARDAQKARDQARQESDKLAADLKAAVQQAAQATRDAVISAKANLNSLGGSLAQTVGQLLDAQAAKRSLAPKGPLAERMKELEKLIHEGKATPQVIREAQRVESELNNQQAAGGDIAKRKERVTRRLADLTDELNTGKIGLARFNREVTQLLRSQGISYKAAGRALGLAFADGFREQLLELRQQALAIIQTPAGRRRGISGFEQPIVRPNEIIREQARNVAAARKKLEDSLVVERQAERKLETVRSQAEAAANRAHAQRQKLIAEQQQANQIATQQRDLLRQEKARQVKPEKVSAAEVARLERERAKAEAKVLSPREIAQLKALRGGGAQAAQGGQETGRSFAQGVARGIREDHSAEGAAAGLAHRIILAARHALGARSPSEVARQQLGRAVIDGIGLGIRDGAPRTEALLAETLLDSLKIAGRRARGAHEAIPLALRAAAEHGPLTLHPVDVASGQRRTLIAEERRQTAVLHQIAADQRAQTTVLREVERELGPRRGGRKKPPTASQEAAATAVHNLLGS